MDERDQHDLDLGTASGSEPAESLSLHADLPPLRTDQGGVVRVGRSRISLDLVVDLYEKGTPPEEMVRTYDALALSDVHAVIAYYLRHRDEVQTYLKGRKEEADSLRKRIEAEHPPLSRQELLKRRAATEKDNAPAGH